MPSNHLTQKINDALTAIGVTVAGGYSRLTVMLEMNGFAILKVDEAGEKTEITLHKSASDDVTAQMNAKPKPVNKPVSKPFAPEPSQYKRRRHP
ncbi:hypothetical protein J7S78_14170 [Klebsiella oxytoca]|uniref:Uncharacterized protein n=1 Tax=Klebsiella oxytoca TaxID=571 RepID=A0AAP2FL89_KLEOX|nr:hypothetical protein [Klebsiella oxytoca]MBQ0600941.1 hypothetical protein [Klebsiella oxytoca]